MADDVLSERKQVNLTFDYEEGPPRAGKVVFEMDDRTDVDVATGGIVRIRQYPPSFIFSEFLALPTYTFHDYEIQVTKGALANTGEVRSRLVSGSVVITGQDEFELPYPVVSGVQLEINGQLYDLKGNTLFGVGMGYDYAQQKVKLSQAVYGEVKYSFSAEYGVYRYTPEDFGNYSTFFGADIENYGSVFAFPRFSGEGQSTVIVFSIQAPEHPSFDFELYRIVSDSVVTADGVWEKPDNFPNQEGFPGVDDTIDTSSGYMVVERAHEIGYLTFKNRGSEVAAGKSVQYSQIPLNFGRELGRMDTGGTDLRFYGNGLVKAARADQAQLISDYQERAKRIPNTLLRTVRYEVPFGKPFVDENPEAGFRYVMYTAVGPLITPLQFKPKLRGVKGRAPTYGDMSSSGATYDEQAARLNGMFRLLYESVDWKSVNAAITAAYNLDVYRLDLTELAPETP